MKGFPTSVSAMGAFAVPWYYELSMQRQDKNVIIEVIDKINSVRIFSFLNGVSQLNHSYMFKEIWVGPLLNEMQWLRKDIFWKNWARFFIYMNGASKKTER